MTWQTDVPLAPLTTLGVGGSARYFTVVDDVAMLTAALKEAHEKSLPVAILGGGSNVLVPDAGIDGLVVRPRIRGISVLEEDAAAVLVVVGAGEVWDDVVAYAVAHGWWGIENLSHIPGSVGAVPIQNVGAYGVEVAHVIEAVTVYDRVRGAIRQVSNTECCFGYRDSIFKHEEGSALVVLDVRLRLKKQGLPQVSYADLSHLVSETLTLDRIRAEVIAIRSRKFPDWRVEGTAGSFFKNPRVDAETAALLRERFPALPLYADGAHTYKCSLGYILDQLCSLKGFRQGNIRLYEKQAMVLVADRGATANEVMAFADLIARRVYECTGIAIEREVQILCTR
jgi:UDP-N-acetylmuramate dehydrogenase